MAKGPLLMVLLTLGCLAGCVLPTKDDLANYPTRNEVRDMAQDEAQFQRDLMQAHDKNMTDQHKTQTPEHSDQLEVLAKSFSDTSLAMVASFKEALQSKKPDIPFSTGEDIFQSALTALLTFFGVQNFGKSRAGPQLNALQSQVSQIAGKLNIAVPPVTA